MRWCILWSSYRLILHKIFHQAALHVENPSPGGLHWRDWDPRKTSGLWTWMGRVTALLSLSSNWNEHFLPLWCGQHTHPVALAEPVTLSPIGITEIFTSLDNCCPCSWNATYGHHYLKTVEAVSPATRLMHEYGNTCCVTVSPDFRYSITVLQWKPSPL